MFVLNGVTAIVDTGCCFLVIAPCFQLLWWPMLEWLVLLVVKVFDSTWKNLASAAALTLGYVARCYFSFEKGESAAKLESTRFLLVLALVTGVLTYSACAPRPTTKPAEEEG
eukprot:GHVU01038314.1.p2 GENE.GHVU01038314.1~~GHVU01038314.1.p2  ORF type:complete len:112 (-),score=11.35 GHVU01038314.1:1783-2118(-)